MTAPPWDVPGLLEAVRAVGELREMVASMGGPGPTIDQVIVTTMAASRPHVQAELLADLSDEVYEIAPAFAAMLDQISHDMRERIDTR